jgi:hypothetical protein
MSVHPRAHLFAPAAITQASVVAEFRRTVFSEHGEVLPFAPGASVADIVTAFDKPDEFATHGVVFLRRGEGKPVEVARECWHRVRPKPGTALFITCAPQGDDSGILALVAAVALVALTAWVGGGGLAFGNPWHYLAAGSFGAQATAAAVGVAGAAALSTLSRPVVGATAASAAESSSLGSAGITQNVMAVNQQMHWPAGTMRVSPPMLSRPFTTIEGTDQYVYGIVGLCGPVEWNALRVNETPVEDLPDGQFEYELRRGFDDDLPLTLVNTVGFEETINLEMSKHRLDKDSATLLAPATASYPTPSVHRTARNPDRFRFTLFFPQGLARFDAGTAILAPFRIEVRALGTGTWRKLPELHLEASVRAPMRQEVWLHFGGDEQAILQSISGVTSSWKRFYSSNAEWAADPYFNASPGAVVDANCAHTYAGADQVHIWLDTAEFPGERYDIRIVRGFVQNAGGQHTTSVYTGGLFTYRGGSDPTFTIPNQSDFAGSVVIQSYTTFRDEYPFRNVTNLALIAFKGKNLQINSINAEATPMIPVWDSVGEVWATPDPDAEPELLPDCSNPAAVARYAAIGPWNKRPRPQSLLSGFEDWFGHCDDEALSCNAVITEGSVERVINLAANCGDAAMRESDSFGPVIDRDRSADGVQHAFSAHNMTSPLIMEKNFDRIADGILPTFVDASRDYATRTLELPVYADGVDVSVGPLLEGANYDGLVFEANVRRRARLDLRRKRHRATKYSWGTHQEQLIAVNGDIVALAHDTLSETYGMGRVKHFTTKSGNLIDIEMNGGLLDLPPPVQDELWDTDHLFVRTIDEDWNLGGPALGAQVRLEDNQIVTVPLSGVEGKRLIVEQGESGFAKPDGLLRTSLIHVGARDQESRRVIILNITPKKDFEAQIDAVDLAPEIFAGL